MLFTGAGGAPTTTQLYEWIVAAGGDPLYLSSQQYALAGDDFHYCGGLSAACWAWRGGAMKAGRGLFLIVLILGAAGPLYLLLKVSVSPPPPRL